ncbi:MAG: ABC transporter, partial [Pleurocapsa sp. MO_226.B13]|nr:ABC transporter [Pleurocapsa sp. MO_226.B13]
MIFKVLKNRTPLGWLQLKRDKMRLITALSGIAFADILIFMQ